jgi:hypothetical protein
MAEVKDGVQNVMQQFFEMMLHANTNARGVG